MTTRRCCRTSGIGAVLLAAAIGLGACEHEPPAAPVENAGCPKSMGEWGLVGCGRLEGTVVDGGGRPMPWVAISVRAIDTAALWSNGTRTDSPAARFVVMYDFMFGPLPDSVPVVVRAIAIGPYHRPTDSTWYEDSVRTTVYFAPVGVRPQRRELKLTIRCGDKGFC
jgi:hypothetical protein